MAEGQPGPKVLVWQHAFALVAAVLVALDLLGAQYTVATRGGFTTNPITRRVEYSAFTVSTVECGNGWAVLTNPPDGCDEHKGTVAVRLTVGGLIVFGLWSWGETELARRDDGEAD